MNFTELDSTIQETIINMLNNHISSSADILIEDNYLIPMLMIPDTKQLFSLESEDGSFDIDNAYNTVIEILKNETFTYALFSYSTRIGLANDDETDALKTYIFTKNGIEVSFYTPYTIQGIDKKTINIEKSIFANLKESIF